MKIKAEDIKNLSDILDINNLSEIEYSDENYKIRIAKQNQAVPSVITEELSTTNIIGEISDIKTIKCPLVGHFYLSPNPGEEPFIKKGSQIKKGDVIGIVQAMKVSNEIKSEYDGIVEEILIGNEEFVDYDASLVKVRINE